MAILDWIILGLAVGTAGRILVRRSKASGFVATIPIGVAGALLGGFASRITGSYGDGEPLGLATVILTSVVLLLLYHLVAAYRSM